MKTYYGTRDDDGCYVHVRQTNHAGRAAHSRILLALSSLKIRNHSPTGFEWGYAGSGPAQLALAILLDFTRSKEIAQAHYQDFKFEVVAGLPKESWSLTEQQIRDWLNARPVAYVGD